MKIAAALLGLACTAGIGPSFALDLCAWTATHIVLADEGEKVDGDFTVAESLHGDLKPGDAVSVPGLAMMAEKEHRSVFAWGDKDESVVLTARRAILFLVRKDGAWVGANRI